MAKDTPYEKVSGIASPGQYGILCYGASIASKQANSKYTIQTWISRNDIIRRFSNYQVFGAGGIQEAVSLAIPRYAKMEEDLGRRIFSFVKTPNTIDVLTQESVRQVQRQEQTEKIVVLAERLQAGEMLTSDEKKWLSMAIRNLLTVSRNRARRETPDLVSAIRFKLSISDVQKKQLLDMVYPPIKKDMRK